MDYSSFFFDLIHAVSPGNKALHRVCSLMRKMGVQAYTTETLEPNAEIAEEHSAACLRCNGVVETEAVRLSFFSSYPSSGDWHDLRPEDFLGYVVHLTQRLPDGDVRRFILESVTRVPTLFERSSAASRALGTVTNYYPHCARRFQSLIGTRDDNVRLSVEGSFFCQQNALTHVCAHAALRMAVNSWQDYSGGKLTNKAINDALDIDHRDRKSPPTGERGRVGHYAGDDWGGLKDGEIQQVIRSIPGDIGFHYADFASNPGIDYAAFIYPLVESCLPVILAVDAPSVSHVVAVLGHTVNSDRWSPEAEKGYGAYPVSHYISSAAWADHFLINDDNFGMYATLPVRMVHNFLVPRYNPNLHAAMAVGLVPGRITITGYEVEEMAALMAILLMQNLDPAGNNRWLQYLRMVVVEGSPRWSALVCRTFFLPKSKYLAHMDHLKDSEGHVLAGSEKTRMAQDLPEEFWVTEVGLPDLYCANKTKLGDLVSTIDPTKDLYVRGDGVVFAWFPGISLWGPGLSGPLQSWSLTGHVPIIRGKPVPLLEW